MASSRQSRIKRGEVIRADFLNSLANGVDELTDLSVKPPKHINGAQNPELQKEIAEDDEAADTDPQPTTFVEQSREIDTVQVFDQLDENYATIERITVITLENGNGETLKLRINN